MGCSGGRSSFHTLEEYTHQNTIMEWKQAKIEIKNTIMNFFKEKNFNNIELGMYENSYYSKAYNSNSTIKNPIRKVFLISKESLNTETKSFLNSFINQHPEFEQYANFSFNKNYFSINGLINTNHSALLKSLNASKDKIIAVSFEDDEKIVTSIKSVMNSSEIDKSKISLYLVEKPTDYYQSYIGYTIFFKYQEDTPSVLCWYSNTNLTPSLCKLIPAYNFKKNESETEDKVKDFVSKNGQNKKSQFSFEYQTLQIFKGEEVISSTFPIVIHSKEKVDESSSLFIQAPGFEKVKYINIIAKKIFSYNLGLEFKVETFKEKKMVIMLKKPVTTQRHFIIKVTSESKYKAIKFLVDKIKEEINPMLRRFDRNVQVRHLVVIPAKNRQIDDYIAKKKSTSSNVYFIINDNRCMEYVFETIIKRYEEIFQKKHINVIINSKSEKNLPYRNYKCVDLEELSDETKIGTFVFSFTKETYNSHILCITDENKKVIFADFFKNTASIYFTALEEFQSLLPIPKEEVKSIKRDFYQIVEGYFAQNPPTLPEVIDPNEIFKTFYDNGKYYQPLISLKYNKEIKNKSEKEYKNYTRNIASFSSDIINKKEFSFKNEISNSFDTLDTYFPFNTEYIKCKNCNCVLHSIITNTKGFIAKRRFEFFICPITKKTFCKECEKLERSHYPFNLMYLQCKNPMMVRNISNNNCEFFKNVYDSKNFGEVVDNLCDVCGEFIVRDINYESKDEIYTFYLLANVINRNSPCFVCNHCFSNLVDEERKWNITRNYNYISTFIERNFIDLNNLIFKRIIVVI